MGGCSLQRLVLFLFFLLWPPFFILAARSSGTPQIAGRWSTRMAAVLVIYLGILIAAGISTLLVLRDGTRTQHAFRRLLANCRRHRWTYWLVALPPPIAGLGLLTYMGMQGVVLTSALVMCFADFAALVAVWEAIVLLGERPMRQRRELHMKLALATASLLLTIAVIETTAAVMGIGRFVDWDINPPNLNVRMRCDEFDVGIVTNAQGLRAANWVRPKPADVTRIVVVGDSMTFGWGVESTEAYGKVAERRLGEQRPESTIEVINMGRPGANPADYLRYVRQYACQLAPDVIVIGFVVGNDCPVSPPVHLNNIGAVDAAFAKYLLQSEAASRGLLERSFLLRLAHANLYRRLSTVHTESSAGVRGPMFGEPNPLAPTRLPNNIDLRQRYTLLSQGGWIQKGLAWQLNPWLVHTALVNPSGAADALGVRPETLPGMKTEWKLCEKLLAEMNTHCQRCNARMIVMAIPQAYQVTPGSVEFLRELQCAAPEAMLTTRRVNDWLNAFCREQAILCIDPLT